MEVPMSLRDFALRAIAVGAALAMGAACGGIVSRGDMCTGSGSGSTGGSPQGACGATEQPAGAAQGSASNGSPGPEGSTTAATTAIARTASASTGSTATSIRVGSGGTGVSVVGTGTSTTSIRQDYSQNAPLPSGDPASTEVTCYGVTDGTSCSVSDINFEVGSTVRTIICSAADNVCSCQLKTTNGTGVQLFPFAGGVCPTGAAGINGSLPPEVCSAAATKLFAMCGW
jgi:hypothetical protein